MIESRPELLQRLCEHIETFIDHALTADTEADRALRRARLLNELCLWQIWMMDERVDEIVSIAFEVVGESAENLRVTKSSSMETANEAAMAAVLAASPFPRAVQNMGSVEVELRYKRPRFDAATILSAQECPDELKHHPIFGTDFRSDSEDELDRRE